MRKHCICILLSWILLISFVHIAHAETVQYALQGDVRYYRNDDKIGLMNSEGIPLTEAVYDVAYPFIGEAAVAAQNGKYGLIDKAGKTLLPFDFTTVSLGEYGVIAAQNGSYGVWNDLGENIIPCEFDLIYENDSTFVAVLDESYGLFSSDGKALLPCTLAGIGAYHSSWLRIVEEDYRVNYINSDGMRLLSAPADYGTDFSVNYAAYVSDGTVYVVDVEGGITPTNFVDVDLFPSMDIFIMTCADGTNVLFDAKQNAVFSLPSDSFGAFSENRLAFSENNLWGFCDGSGKVIIPAQYDWVWPYCNGISCVQQNNQWFYINPLGEPVCAQTFDEAYSFSEGLAACVDRSTKLTGFINTEGEWSILPIHASLGPIGFYKGVCALNGTDPYENTFINICGEIICDYSVPIGYFGNEFMY